MRRSSPIDTLLSFMRVSVADPDVAVLSADTRRTPDRWPDPQLAGFQGGIQYQRKNFAGR